MTRLLYLLLFLFAFTKTDAQIVKSFSIKSGISLSNPYYELTAIEYRMGTRAGLGYTGGIGFGLYQNQKLLVEMEFSYVRHTFYSSTIGVSHQHLKGDKLIAKKGDEYACSISSVNFTPLLKYKVPFAGLNALVIAAPSIMFNADYSTDSPFDLNHFKTAAFGFNYGFGLEKQLGEQFAVALECRHSPNITNIHDSQGVLIKNNSFSAMLSLSYLFIANNIKTTK